MKKFDSVSENELLYYAINFLTSKISWLKGTLLAEDFPLSSKCRKEMEELLALYDKQYDELYVYFYAETHKK